MIGAREGTAAASGVAGPGTAPSAPGAPWEVGRSLAGLGLVCVWATGSDPATDGVFRLAALRRGHEGRWIAFERRLDPFPGARRNAPERPTVSARMAREFGVRSEELVGGAEALLAFAELAEFLGDAPLLVADRRTFEAWARAFWPPERPRTAPLFDVASLAALLGPGRLPGEGDRAVAQLLGGPRLALHPRAVEPADLHAALAALVSHALGRDEAGLALLALGLTAAWEGLRGRDPEAAERLALAARLLERPSQWRDGPSGLFPGQASGPGAPGRGVLSDGQLSDALRAYELLGDAVEAATPAWSSTALADRRRESLPAFDAAGEERLLDEVDRERVDRVFRDVLPRRFAERTGAAPSFREGQWRVAHELAASFGRRELALVHAPTGTGKTLAYLVPVALWALRHGIRVGIATYTRALQEQAMEREVPIALEALRAVDVTGELRVSSLKGRNNYLCWRALKLQTPVLGGGEEPAEVLAWTALALFALDDAEGDLDRFPRRSPLPGTSLDEDGLWQTALERLLRAVRSETGCCAHKEDRETCGAEVARRRAERSHVVVTNHAFALARRDFFRHLVFDECEHLHEVAHNAFSHGVTTSALRELLRRLRGRRGPLDRIESVTIADGPAWTCVRACADAQERGLLALERLSAALGDFKLWREEAAALRDPADLHSLFREYAELEEAAFLLDAHRDLARAWNDLVAGLAQLAEHLDTLPTRNVLRLRRGLDVQRADVEDALEAIEAWLPRRDGDRPDFRPHTFYDLETNARGQDVLAARVLLPHEYLGRHYYPDLAGAVLISATTRLKGGFEASAVYLGVERAARPADDEERAPFPVRTFEAPEVFDYGRVLVAAPRDAPDVRQGKRAFLDYVARFLSFLAERTRGRCLALFTNLEDVTQVGRALRPFFDSRRLPLLFQGMPEAGKEELSARFRDETEATLLGVDTFWYGADFPGQTLEYLVIVRLPYGVPDRYHHAQCAALGPAEQRRQIYMPRALAKLRQGFGRLMRTERDRGCVFLLDGRINDPRHRSFLKELPLRGAFVETADPHLARFVTGDTDHCLREAFAHMEMGADVRRRGLETPFGSHRLDGRPATGRSRRPEREGGERERTRWPARPLAAPPPEPPSLPEVAEEDLPF